MADGEASESTRETTESEGGVLANLPRRRPQRSSARRAAARAAASTNGGPPAPVKETSTAARAAKARGKHAKIEAQPTKRAERTETKRAAPVAGRRPAPTKDSAAAAQAKAADTPRPSSVVRARRARAAKRPVAPRRAAPVEEPAPRQGFECEGSEGPVQPPGGPELVASAAELVSELAKASLSAGERLLKDVFSRLPGS